MPEKRMRMVVRESCHTLRLEPTALLKWHIICPPETNNNPAMMNAKMSKMDVDACVIFPVSNQCPRSADDTNSSRKIKMAMMMKGQRNVVRKSVTLSLVCCKSSRHFKANSSVQMTESATCVALQMVVHV